MTKGCLKTVLKWWKLSCLSFNCGVEAWCTFQTFTFLWLCDILGLTENKTSQRLQLNLTVCLIGEPPCVKTMHVLLCQNELNWRILSVVVSSQGLLGDGSSFQINALVSGLSRIGSKEAHCREALTKGIWSRGIARSAYSPAFKLQP